MGWVFKMAWRDSRRGRKRLFVFSLAIVLGVAALVGVRGYRDNLEMAVADQARGLLGADLLITSRQAPDNSVEAFLAGIPGERSREISFTSMATFPEADASRLVMVRAFEGGFPWYGEIGSDPSAAAASWRAGEAALLEESLLRQLDLGPGERVRLGGVSLPLAGALRQIPGEGIGHGQLAPRVLVPMAKLEGTGLLQAGGLARYRSYYRLPEGTDADAWVDEHARELSDLRLSTRTVEGRKEDLGATFDNLARFLNLAGLVALLLGGVGEAAGVYGYVSRKRDTAAILRCLGSSNRQVLAVYLIQGAALGLAGAGVGALLGVGIQRLLPGVFSGLIPVEVVVSISGRAIAEGLAVGFGVCVLFATWPIAALRRVTPLRALRASVSDRDGALDPVVWAIAAVLVAGVWGYLQVQFDSPAVAAGFLGGLGLVFLTLTVLSWLLLWGARYLAPARAPFSWRQGVASLYRPNNRTVALLVSLGLGTCLIAALAFSRDMLVEQVRFSEGESAPNLAFFDIQDDQVEPLRELLRERALPVEASIPIVTMRIQSIRGRSVSELLRENAAPGWTLRREYRSTYRGALTGTERLAAGRWIGSVEPDEEPVPISVETGLAEDLGLALGDEIVWDVQGVPLPSVVASLRDVEWRRISPNFFVVFPEGVLEPAPKFHVLLTRTVSPEETGRVQRAASERFGNISAVDLRLVVDTVEGVLERIVFVARFMAGFTVATGFVVLLAVAATARYQRRRESCLLRTLGASAGQLSAIRTVEFLVLGTLAATAGLVLACGAGWALGRYVFALPFTPSWTVILSCWALVAGATVAIGWLTELGGARRPPLEVLRESGEG